MKKAISKLQLLFCVILIGALSCKKETSDTLNNDVTINKVNTWLDNQIILTKSAKAQNIQLLKENLDIANLKLENSEENEQLVIIPIKEAFKQLRNIDNKTTLYFVAIMNKTGSIRKANLVMYIPAAGKIITALPDKTFYNILNEGKNVASGQFRFLSVTGRWLYQLEYNKNGDLSAFGLIQQKSKLGDGNISTNGVTTLSTCTDWYLVTTYYYSDGTTSQTSDYVGTTCDGCGDTMNQSLCPDSGGGGSTSEYEFAASKQPTWYVYDEPGGGNVLSFETIKGKKVSGENQGGHFTDIVKGVSSCTSCSSSHPYDVWIENSHDVSYSAQSASASVDGRLQFGGFVYFPSNSKSWTFAELFP